MKENDISQFGEAVATEQCVLCGRNTGVPTSKPVEDRMNYVYGCGQLCGLCFSSLRHDSHYFE